MLSLFPARPLLEYPFCPISLSTLCPAQENPLCLHYIHFPWTPIILNRFHDSIKYITSPGFILLLSSFMCFQLIPPNQWRLLKVRDHVLAWSFMSATSHPPPSPHKAVHIKGIQWILVYSNPIIVGNFLSDLWMSKFSIFNFLFVCGTQQRPNCLKLHPNFCLLSMVWVISCRQKKKRKRLLASGKHFLWHYYWRLMLTWNYFFILAELWTQIHVVQVSLGVNFSLIQTSEDYQLHLSMWSRNGHVCRKFI